MVQKATSVWFSRVLFESMLITISILAALALDEWREERQDLEMVDLALSNFLLEIRQNKARIDDAAPFNTGLRDVLRNRDATGDIDSIDEFVSIVESYTPGVLQVTAWETALATGALAKMEYNLVSALSLTYSMQGRYQLAVQSGAAELTSPQNLAQGNLQLAVFNSIRYLNEMTRIEAELAAIYDEAASVIVRARQKMRGEAAADDEAAQTALSPR
ncbi:MAG: hypothetical protein ACREQZ_12360 [Woeseiaceae bacterium]